MILIDAKALSAKIREQVKAEIGHFDKVRLSVILVGNDEMSKVYVNNKRKALEEVGISTDIYAMPDVSEGEVLSLIMQLNADNAVHGVIVQLPLPNHLNPQNILEAINPMKDVDGLTSKNFGQLWAGEEKICPCTPKGVISLLDYYGISLSGKRIVVIGRSRLVGRPLAAMLLNRDATVTICHTRTWDLKSILVEADIIISAAGTPHIVDRCKNGAVIINVGMTKRDGRIVGDIDIPRLENASYVTRILGSTGLMTVTSLMGNLIKCYKLQKGLA